MNNSTKIFIITLAALLVLSACKKDNYIPEPVISDVACLLKEINSYDADSIKYVQSLDYDNNRRLIKIPLDKISYWSISYDNNGRESNIAYTINANTNWYQDFFLGNNSLTTLEYSKENDDWYVSDKTDYEFDTYNQIIKIQRYYKLYEEWEKGDSIINTWENGNLVKAEEYGFNGEKNGVLIYEFDDRNNAYSSFKYAQLWNINTMSKNNIKKRIYTYRDRILYEDNYTYEYNKKAYPTKKTSIRETESRIDTSVVFFEYDCLE